MSPPSKAPKRPLCASGVPTGATTGETTASHASGSESAGAGDRRPRKKMKTADAAGGAGGGQKRPPDASKPSDAVDATASRRKKK